MATKRIVVLISGRGSNLQALIDRIAAGELKATIALVISDRACAQGLQWAARAGIQQAIIERANYPSTQLFETALQSAIDRAQPHLVVLAGFMQILSPTLVAHYRGRILNIHPSLLPALPGLNTHQRALDEAHRQHGATVHVVTSQLDGGPHIIQAVLQIASDDNAHTLAARVLQCEHKIYFQAIQWALDGRLHSDGHHVWLDGEQLDAPISAYF